MSDPKPLRDRYASRAGDLRPDSGGAPDPARILVAAGDLLRRRAALGPDLGAIDDALRALDDAAIEAWTASLDEAAHRASFERAAEAAALVALADSEEERAIAASSALAALQVRDGLASAAVALQRRGELGVEVADTARRALAAHLEALDRAALPRARWLVGLNDLRRQERDLLDPPMREPAYWYAARAGCDGLLAALAGDAPGSGWDAHLRGCALCTADLARSKPIESPPTAHLSADDLFRYDLGELGPRERARLERHADACFACGQALWALADGDRAIEESAALGPSTG